MKTNSTKLRMVLIIYTGFLYGFWSLLELSLKNSMGISEFTKEVWLKFLIWLLPSLLIYLRFSSFMFSGEKEFFSLNRKCWICIPLLLFFTVYIIGGEYLENGMLSISPSFGVSTVVEVISIAAGEEMVFRGLFLNAALQKQNRYLAVFINALMFLAIHFPAWIQSGTFVFVFSGGGFISILLLSCIFSFAFIKTKSILPAAILHFWWDLLMFMF